MRASDTYAYPREREREKEREDRRLSDRRNLAATRSRPTRARANLVLFAPIVAKITLNGERRVR